MKVVDEFNYLGMTFSYNGKFRLTQNIGSNQDRNALFGLLSTQKDYELNVTMQLYPFRWLLKCG